MVDDCSNPFLTLTFPLVQVSGASQIHFIIKKSNNNATPEWHRTLNDCILISNEHVFQKGRANKNLICFTALICSVHKAKTEVVLVMGAV